MHEGYSFTVPICRNTGVPDAAIFAASDTTVALRNITHPESWLMFCSFQKFHPLQVCGPFSIFHFVRAKIAKNLMNPTGFSEMWSVRSVTSWPGRLIGRPPSCQPPSEILENPPVTFAKTKKDWLVELVSGKALNCDSRGCSVEVKGARWKL